MMQYVENLKRTYEKDHAELMEFKKLANQNSNRSYGGSVETGGKRGKRFWCCLLASISVTVFGKMLLESDYYLFISQLFFWVSKLSFFFSLCPWRWWCTSAIKINVSHTWKGKHVIFLGLKYFNSYISVSDKYKLFLDCGVFILIILRQCRLKCTYGICKVCQLLCTWRAFWRSFV